MKQKKTVKNTIEFDERFDNGEDIHDLLDMSRAGISRPGKKVRITLDVAEELIREIDRIREGIGVDRSVLIKVWLYEKVKQENAAKTRI